MFPAKINKTVEESVRRLTQCERREFLFRQRTDRGKTLSPAVTRIDLSFAIQAETLRAAFDLPVPLEHRIADVVDGDGPVKIRKDGIGELCLHCSLSAERSPLSQIIALRSYSR